MIVTSVELAGAPLARGSRDPYQLRREVNAELGMRELLRSIIVPGRYAGAAITDVGETVTIPGGSVFWLDVGTKQCLRVELTADVVESTDEGGGDDSLYIRAVEGASEGGPAVIAIIVEAAPDGTPPGPNSLKIGNTAAGTFTVDAGLDKVLAN